jgi:hypothetical protein
MPSLKLSCADAAAAKALLDGAGVKMQPEYIFDTYYNDPLSANVMTAP